MLESLLSAYLEKIQKIEKSIERKQRENYWHFIC